MNTTPTPIVALDVPGSEQAFRLLGRLGPRAGFVKVGLQLYTAAGPELVRALRSEGRRVFLDLKLHDIPNTVAGAVAAAAGLGVEMLTVHASGGPEMLRAARREAGEKSPRPLLFAVTVLTSLDAAALASVWGRGDAGPASAASRLARL
ncbi:MAG: orotidine-5'-phosphate decarboxylase, partial [Longimicrobiaceae bacterium]